MNITIIVFGIDKALEFEWLISEIDHTKFHINFISIYQKSETSLGAFCNDNSVPFYHILYRNKKDLPKAIFQTYKRLKKLQPDIVHSHIFEGGLIGVTAAWLAGVKNRIYTRHYSDFHHVYFPNGLKYDKWINKKSTHIIAVSEVVKEILIEKENVLTEKVSLIHHGIKIERKEKVTLELRINDLKERNIIPKDKTIIGVVSRYTFWKGVQDIIPAFKSLYETNNNLHLVLANAKGDYSSEIKSMLSTLPDNSYTEILFENDNEALFGSFDIFVHVPVSREAEAFGQIYIEALKFGIPSVFTLSGIANELVRNEGNALVVDYKNTEQIKIAVQRLIENKELGQNISDEGKRTVESFTTMKKTIALEKLYTNIFKK